MTLPLTKTLDEADFALLTQELRAVDVHFADEAEQHPMRRWEYAMALRAVKVWDHPKAIPLAYDIGGGGSPFMYMLADQIATRVHVVDPAYTPNAYTLAQLLQTNPRLGDIVTCLSVLEHVEDLDQVCYELGCLVAPGGLLFLTMDLGDTRDHHPLSAPDPFHFHWMRKRIFTLDSHRDLWREFYRWGFQPLGGIDAPGVEPIIYHGAHVYDYTFASLALQKRA